MWEAWKAGDRKGALAAIPDALVDELIVHGSPAECRATIQRYFDNGVTTSTAILPLEPLRPSPRRSANCSLQRRLTAAPGFGGGLFRGQPAPAALGEDGAGLGDAGQADAAGALVELQLGRDAGRREQGELGGGAGGGLRGHGASVRRGCHRVSGPPSTDLTGPFDEGDADHRAHP